MLFRSAEAALYAARKMPKPGPEAYRAIRTLFNVPIFKMVYPLKKEPFWRWPAKQGGDQRELE